MTKVEDLINAFRNAPHAGSAIDVFDCIINGERFNIHDGIDYRFLSVLKGPSDAWSLICRKAHNGTQVEYEKGASAYPWIRSLMPAPQTIDNLWGEL